MVHFRTYYEIVSDLVGLLHLQGGDLFGLTEGPNGESIYVRMLDDFKMGPISSVDFSPLVSVRATSRPAPPTTRLALLTIGALAWKFSIRSTSCPRTPVPCSSIPATEWGYKGETTWPFNSELNGRITTSTGMQFICGNCGLQFADSAESSPLMPHKRAVA